MSLQSKVVLFFAVLLLLIAFEWVFFSAFEGRVLREEMSDRGSVLVRTLALLSAEPLLSFQITRLERLLDSVLEEKDVLYARIYNTRYTVLAATDREQEGWSFSGPLDDSLQIEFTPEAMTTRAPISTAGQRQGMAEIAFSLSALNGKINRSRTIFLIIFVGELLLAASFALFLEIQLVNPLAGLAGGVRALGTGALDQPLPSSPLAAREIVHLRRSLDEMREKLATAQRELVARTRLATMGQIAANITHEIRNPLEAISGAVEILSGERGLDSDSRDSIAIVREEIRNLDEYLNQFLELARPLPVRPVEADLNALLEDSLLLLRPLLRKKHLTVSLRRGHRLPPCRVDVNQIKRVFVNVILNSAEALGEGGSLRITSSAEGPRVAVRIEDDGQGIRPEDLPQVFDPYFTTKNGGSGLGLPLSRRIVEQHGGTLHIESAFGRGTVVTVWLPAAPDGDGDG